MNKEDLIKKIIEAKEIKGSNSMGASESWYNEYYMVREFAKENNLKLEDMELKEIENLLKLAEFAGDVFY